MDLLAEGVESALMACSLIVLAPGVATALAARRAAVPALVAFSMAVLGSSWLRFSDRGGGLQPVLIAVILAAAVAVLLLPRSSRREIAGVGGGLLAGVGAAELWRPCVGFEFGQVLNGLPDRGIPGVALLAVYLLGVLSPLLALGAVHHLVPERHRELAEPWLAGVGAAALGALALATAFGLHDDLVGKLFEWSVES